jgi:hypothetical protein
MHVLHRPHLPRLISVSIAAAALAVVISLALAASISTISQSADTTSISPRQSTPVATSVLHATTPRWVSNPFASLVSRPLPQPWLTARPSPR